MKAMKRFSQHIIKNRSTFFPLSNPFVVESLINEIISICKAKVVYGEF